MVEGFQRNHVLINEILKKYGSGSSGAVTIVDTLPEEGEMGKIYFNDEDGKYYGYYGNRFTEFGASAMPVVRVREITPSGPEEYNLYNTHTLEPNIYYVLPDVVVSDDPLVVKSNILTLNLEGLDMNFANQYICRVKALQDDMSIVLPSGVYFADNNPSIEAGHLYEINILYDVCLITDISYSTE
jgi:hypothetical protein